MAYTPFDETKPVSTQTGTQCVDSMRENLAALRDAVVAGSMEGWNLSASGGTAEQPAEILYSNGTERVKLALTWGTTGGEDGNVTVCVYSYSSDSGSTYDTIGTITNTYDSNSNLTATTWS